MMSDQNIIFRAPCLATKCHKLRKFHVAHTILDIRRCILSQNKGHGLEIFSGGSPPDSSFLLHTFGRRVYFLSFTNIQKDRPTELGFYGKNDSSTANGGTLLNFLGSYGYGIKYFLAATPILKSPLLQRLQVEKACSRGPPCTRL